MKKRYQKWGLTIAAAGGLAGMLLGQVMFGNFNASSVLGALTGFLIIFAANFLYVRSKRDKTPEVDERTISNLRKYYAIIANVFLGILFITIAAVGYMGHESISLSYLWVFIIAYMLISGIGGLVVMRR